MLLCVKISFKIFHSIVKREVVGCVKAEPTFGIFYFLLQFGPKAEEAGASWGIKQRNIRFTGTSLYLKSQKNTAGVLVSIPCIQPPSYFTATYRHTGTMPLLVLAKTI